MKKYNYFNAVTQDIITIIQNNPEYKPRKGEAQDDYMRRLANDTFLENSVTGLARGWYISDKELAYKWVMENFDLYMWILRKNGGDRSLNEFYNNMQENDVELRCDVFIVSLFMAVKKLNFYKS